MSPVSATQPLLRPGWTADPDVQLELLHSLGGGGGGDESESGSGGQRKWAVYHSATKSETQPFELVTVMDNFPVGFTQASCCEGAAPNNSNKKTVNNVNVTGIKSIWRKKKSAGLHLSCPPGGHAGYSG